jgi:hypothetical protein
VTGGNGAGTVWVVGCTGNGQAHRFNGSVFQADPKGGFGQRIGVESSGRPWVVNSDGDIYRRSSTSLTGGVWQIRPSDGSFSIGTDVGVFRANSYVWVWSIGNGNTWVWNEQSAQGDPKECLGACAANWWQWDDGAGTRIAVGPCGPWVVDAGGTVYRRAECEHGLLP